VKPGMNLFYMLKAASAAHARWEYETSMNILRSKKRLLILGLLFLPCVLLAVAIASDQLPAILGGHKAYSPAYSTSGLLWVSTLIGLMAGLITGCIGAGGGFIITPALMSVGVKGILSVGTDLFHIFAKAIMGTTIHKKLGNVSVGLAIAFLVGSIVGVSCGGVLNRAIYEISPVLSDCFITIIYVFLLGFLGFYALLDFVRNRKAGAHVGAHTGESPRGEEAASGKKGLPARLQSINIPPSITFDRDLVPGGKRISAWFVARRISHFPHVRLYPWRFFIHHSGHGHFADHLYCRVCLHRPVCHLWLHILLPGHGPADRIPYRNPSRGAGHESRQGHLHPRFLCHCYSGRVLKPSFCVAWQTGRNAGNQHLQVPQPYLGRGRDMGLFYRHRYFWHMGDFHVYKKHETARGV